MMHAFELQRADLIWATALGALTLISPEEAATLDEVSFADWLGRFDVPQPIMSFLSGIANGVFML